MHGIEPPDAVVAPAPNTNRSALVSPALVSEEPTNSVCAIHDVNRVRLFAASSPNIGTRLRHTTAATVE